MLILLRRLELGDATALEQLQSDEAVKSYLGMGKSQVSAEDSIRSQNAHFDRTGWGLFAIAQSESNRFVGYVGFIPCPAAGPDAHELVCAVSPELRGCEIGTLACEQAIDWGFATHGWPSIYARVAHSNKRVHDWAQSLGMQPIRELSDVFDGAQTLFAREASSQAT